MLSEASLIGLPNLPKEINERFDQPWHFIGLVNLEQPWMNIRCISEKCNENIIDQICAPRPNSVPFIYQQIHSLKRYPIVTGDALFIPIYFGVCSDCGQVYWAKSAPPYERVTAPRH